MGLVVLELLEPQCIFTLPKSSTAQRRKTAIKSFHPSCRSLLIRQGNLLPWDRYCYGQRLLCLWDSILVTDQR